jgi:predicted PurR-regulated permease PerM
MAGSYPPRAMSERIVRSAAPPGRAERVRSIATLSAIAARCGGVQRTMILLEIVLGVLAIAFFWLMDLYTAGCERV